MEGTAGIRTFCVATSMILKAARSFWKADNPPCDLFTACETRLSVAMTFPALNGFAKYHRPDRVAFVEWQRPPTYAV
jgi:hypothetical protein